MISSLKKMSAFVMFMVGDKLLAETLVWAYMCLIITILLLRRMYFHILLEISCFSLRTSALIATL